MTLFSFLFVNAESFFKKSFTKCSSILLGFFLPKNPLECTCAPPRFPKVLLPLFQIQRASASSVQHLKLFFRGLSSGYWSHFAQERAKCLGIHTHSSSPLANNRQLWQRGSPTLSGTARKCSSYFRSPPRELVWSCTSSWLPFPWLAFTAPSHAAPAWGERTLFNQG